MAIKVLFFGATAALVGLREIEMDAAAGTAVREVFARVLDKYPELAGRKLLISVNEEYSQGNEILRDGDEIAIFTAVSGG